MQHSRLSIIDSFKCLAEKCPDSCCARWPMSIDDSAMKAWEKLEDTQLQSYLQVSIKEISDDRQHSYVFNKDEQGRCVHLTKTNLCNIQQKYGKQFLPQSCQQYPLFESQKLNATLESAYMSCPAIVDLVLASETSAHIENEMSLYSEQGMDVISRLSQTIYQHMKNLFGVDGLYLGIKIYALSTMLVELNTMATEVTLTTDMLDSRFALSLEELQDKWLQWRTQSQNQEFNKNRAEIEKFLQMFNSGLLDRYRKQLAQKFDMNIPHFTLKNLYNWRKEQDISRFSVMFEQYMQIKLINNGFPWNPDQNDHTASFLDCVFPLMLCHAMLIAYHQAGKELTEQEIKKIIVNVEALNAHSYDNYRLISAKSVLNELSRYNIVFTLLV